MTDALRYLMHMTCGIQNIRCLTQKLNHVFNNNNCLFFIYMKQLSLYSYMTVEKKHYISRAEQGFLDGVYNEVWITKFVHCHHTHKNK